ncbi:hypothetical protein PAXRUDRAFT_19590 [Paxillus rubicundulus Ve08.2h10]|uniref:Unplaced genomic scaffold scaffold_3785, whole genome shotgun sequence n=1 Tax=Paxillus rubicundulus Ve08.2h10 TaxID=930991 RepID=A0A0D0CHP6_9AGAM|nr:hypothetical protein PAXRUDRAFT_19590 [Paxillus rubicundulus Ve08.2h10]
MNSLAISPQGFMLLSGGNDHCIVIWNLSSGEMIQDICVPSAGFISCLSWIKADDRDESAFIFGASDGNLHLYE